MRIDAHQHFWRIARGDYGWLTPALGAIHRDFAPQDLRPLLSRHDIERTILVQAAPTGEETSFLLDLARHTSFVAGVVGWVDLTARDAPARIADHARNARLVGLRPMVQDIPDDDWLTDPVLQPALEAMQRHRLVFDALVLPRHLSRLSVVVARNPSLAFVVDHAAKPFIRERVTEPWRTHLREIAAYPNTFCKLSGLVTEASADWTVDDLAQYVDTVLSAFGPARVMWGSDWPVVNLGGGYDRWMQATSTLLRPLAPEERAQVLGGTAQRVYLDR